MFKNLLDPHSEKALRKALDTLDMSLLDQRQALAQLVLENQEKLLESKLLDEIHDSRTLFEISFNAEAPLQNILEEKLNKVLSASDGAQIEKNKQLLEKYLHPLNSKAVFHFAALCEQPELFSQASAALTSNDRIQLLSCIKNDELKKKLLSEINDMEVLKNLEKHFSSKDKRSYRLVQDRILHIENEQKLLEDFKHQCQKSVSSMESLAKSAYAPLYDSKHQHLLDEWKQLHKNLQQHNILICNLIEQSDIDSFENNSKICEKIIKKHKLAEETEKQKSQDSIFLEGALDKLRNFISAASYPQEACEALAKSINEKLEKNTVPESFNQVYYQSLCKIMSYEKELQTETTFFEQLEASITSLQELFNSNHKKKKAEQQTLKEIEALADKLKSLKKKFPEIDLESEGKRLVDEKLKTLNALKSQCLSTQDEFRAKFDKKTGYIKSEVENKALTTVERLCREAEELIPFCRFDQHEQLQKRLTGYQEELAKLEDWFNFATLPKRKELLAEMEALASKAKQTKIKVLKEEIKQLQHQWRELGHARDEEGKALWNKFKEQGDLAYQPIQQLIEKKEHEKLENLEKRQQLLDTLKQHIQDISAQAPSDWNDSEKLLSRSEKHWQEAFPVPGGNQQLQEQFNQALESLKQLLIPQRKINLGKKKALIDSAKQLLTLGNIREAIDKAKQLQLEWKHIGITEDDQNLWQEFRETCDQVFKERDQIKEQQQSKEKQSIKAAQDICLALENINENNPLDFESEIRKLVSQFEGIHDIPKKRSDIFKQFSKARKNASRQLQELKHKQQSKTFDELNAMCKALAPLENELLKNENSAETLETAKNLVNNSALDEKNKATLIKSLIELQQAKDKNNFIADKNAKAKERCITLEIECDVDSPAQDKASRMEIQVKRLNQKFNSKTAEASLEQRIMDAFLSGGIYSYQDASYAERLLKLQQKTQL